jgi:GR25 family glycosyltransferase involved in LPS biosynthesis
MFLKNIPFYCIHLTRIREREPFLTQFQNALGRPVQIWEASEGMDVLHRGWPRKHPFEAQTSIGALGCLDSHIRLLEEMVRNEIPILGVFEDDAEVVASLETLTQFYEQSPPWDILVLGANEWVDLTRVDDTYVKPTRYWGTHAFLITLDAAKKVILAHKELLKQGYAFPADWLYSHCISKYSLQAYGPFNCKGLIRQKPGLVSAINGKVRT